MVTKYVLIAYSLYTIFGNYSVKVEESGMYDSLTECYQSREAHSVLDSINKKNNLYNFSYVCLPMQTDE